MELPYMHLRASQITHTYTLDYYDDLESPDVTTRFAAHFQTASRRAEYELGSLMPREHPFRQIECVGCRIALLTNRFRGEGFRCAACQQEGEVTYDTEADPRPSEIAANEVLGKRLRSRQGWNVTLGVRGLTHSVNPVALLDAFKREGFDVSYAAQPAVAERLRQALNQSQESSTAGQPTLLFFKVLQSREPGFEGATVPELEASILRVRREAGPIATATAVQPPSVAHAELRTELDRALRDAATADTAEAAQRLREAAISALAKNENDPAAWRALGLTELRSGSYEGAMRAFTRAHQLEPTSGIAAQMAYEASMRTRDIEEALKWAAILMAMGRGSSDAI